MSKSEFILDFEKPIRGLEQKIELLHESSSSSKVDVQDEIDAIRRKLEATKNQIYSTLTPWQRVQLARHPHRPTTLDYIELIFSEFQELHGDRHFKEDHALIGGPAILDGKPVMLIGHQKGRDTKENMKRNFGCPHPEGYRKALRLMQQAEKFQLPIITFVDTQGAYPGIGAEERHVAEAIAVNIREMSTLRVPIVTIIIGEGGVGRRVGNCGRQQDFNPGKRILFSHLTRGLRCHPLEGSRGCTRSGGGIETGSTGTQKPQYCGSHRERASGWRTHRQKENRSCYQGTAIGGSLRVEHIVD